MVATKEKIRDRIKEVSYKENHIEKFKLASGGESPYYFDLKQVLLDPWYLKMTIGSLMTLMSDVLGELPKAVSGLTMGADPLVYGISLRTNTDIYPLPVRKATKDHGSKKRVEGLTDMITLTSQNVVLIDDVITTGGSTLQALDALEEMSFEVNYAFCVLDRKEGGRKNLADRGVELYSLFTIDDFRDQ